MKPNEINAWTSAIPMQAPELERLLIVEDEPRLRQSTAVLMSRDGREILQCGTGSEALALLTEQDVGVILLDLNLPDMSGIDVLMQLRTVPSTASVIVVSAEKHIDSAIQCLRYGAAEFIRKPFKPEHLERTVDNLLHRRRLERSHAFMTARLEESEHLHRCLVDESPDIIYTLDEEGRFAFVSGRVETLLGYSRNELIGQHFSVIVDVEDRDNAMHAFNERRTGERANSNVEVRLRHKDDTGHRHFEMRFIVAILNSTGIYQRSEGNRQQRFIGTYGVACDITERKRAEELANFHAYHDHLTALPNRTLFNDRLDLAIRLAERRNEVVAVILINLDRFKLVNDTYGNAEGDQLLQKFSERLSGMLRSVDTVSRQGGDEFSILLPDLKHADDAELIARNIMEAMTKPFIVGGRDFIASVSIGISLYPNDGESPEVLLRHADLAMYSVKKSGKNAIAFFSHDMRQGHRDHIALENDLRRAIERGELKLVYQPQVSAAQHCMLGVEALLRWHHPDHGLIDPSRFLALAEEAGFIHLISDWVLDEACRQSAIWHALGHKGLRMSVNLSPRDFERDDVVERVIAALETHGLPTGALEVEITENLLVQDVERVIDKVRSLRRRGVHVAIDDFGTRYSSLNYLRQFPVSCIKIDQSFIRPLCEDAGAASIVSAIIGIAQGFNLHLIAEGVETIAQVDLLRSLGCDTMQGFHFARPMTADAVQDMLTNYPAALV